RSTIDPFSHRNAVKAEKSHAKEKPTICVFELIKLAPLLDIPSTVPRSIITPFFHKKAWLTCLGGLEPKHVTGMSALPTTSPASLIQAASPCPDTSNGGAVRSMSFSPSHTIRMEVLISGQIQSTGAFASF